MVGLVAAVVCGTLPIAYIDTCFVEGLAVTTPLAPSEPMWLDRVQVCGSIAYRYPVCVCVCV